MTSARTLQPQDQIAHYRIVGPLGAGGMGEVYLAQDQTLERNVALKILPPELVQSEERVRRFVREAKSASSLNHPNIVTIYEIGQDEVHGAEGGVKDSGSSALHYISMELVSGDTLSTKIHLDKTDLRTLLGYLAQAAEGLAKAHAAGIVHRDLKPGNIMVSKDGFAKVLDFGLAKLTEKAPADADVTSGPTHGDGTSVGAVVGTVGYMSPEQVRGAVVDHRSDIFSFGCILYEAATRKKPFTAESNVETMHKILHDKPTPVEEINKDVPTEVRRLIRRCLAKNPEQRFQSAKDLAIELREIVDEYDSLTASGSSASGSSALGAPIAARKRISPIALIAGAVVLGGVLLAVGMLLGRGKSGGSGSAPSAVRISTLTSRGITNDPALSPDGRYLAYTQTAEGRKSIWVRQVATGSDVQILAPQDDAPFALTFNPDGSYLYYLGNDPERAGYKALFEIPTLGGTPRKRTYDVDSRVSFSPDGKQVCFHRGVPHRKQDALVIFNLTTGQGRDLATVTDPAQFEQPAWSPDGKRIAIIETSGGGGKAKSVVTYRVADGKREPIGKNAWVEILDLCWLPDGKALILSAFVPPTALSGQLWKLDFPSGNATRITSDTNFYVALSASSDGSTVAAVRFKQESNLWCAAPTGAKRVRQATFGSDDDGGVGTFASGEDSTIYFDTIKDEDPQIWSISAGGENATKLTSGHRFAFGPFFRPGSGLVFQQGDDDLIQHLWRSDLNGEHPRQLTTGNGETILDVSPDGRTVLFERRDVPDVLWSVPTQGGDAVRLGAGSRATGQFSPDGTKILHTVVQNVQGEGFFIRQIMPANGGEPKVTPALPPRADDLRWTGDGTGITYIHASNELRNLFRLPLDGGKPIELTHFTEGVVRDHVWSPDGKRILVVRRVGAAINLWVTDANGGNATPITDFETGQLTNPGWSRDGSRIYFTYGAGGQNVVLIRNFQ